MRFAELPDTEVPTEPGIYAVLRPDPNAPRRFISPSPAGWFKDRDPTIATGALEARWVHGTATLYLGKATRLRVRYLAALTDATQAEIVDRAVSEYAYRARRPRTIAS